MNKRTVYKYFIIVAFACLAIFSGCSDTTIGGVKIPRLDPKYGYRDKEPMGGYIAYHYLNSLFNYGVSDVIRKSFSKLRYEINYSSSLYIIIAKSVIMNRNDVESMMQYVGNGNTVFISADYIDDKLIDTLGLNMTLDLSGIYYYAPNEYKREKKDTWVSLANENSGKPKTYGFYFVPFSNSITAYDTSVTQVLGYNERFSANFVSVNYGQGKFVFHTAPAAFSNYFLLTGNNREYFEKTFSYFDPQTSSVYWDDFYRLRKSSDEDFTIFNFFKKHQPLLYAFLIVLGLLLLFISFGGKRRRRLVPERMPNVNTTVSYTETIGRLYLQKKDNRNIALKMFTYFLEHVRSSYYLNTQTLNNDFADALSRKSGVPEVKVKRLLELMNETDQADKISDMRLLEMHNLLQDYFKK